MKLPNLLGWLNPSSSSSSPSSNAPDFVRIANTHPMTHDEQIKKLVELFDLMNPGTSPVRETVADETFRRGYPPHIRRGLLVKLHYELDTLTPAYRGAPLIVDRPIYNDEAAALAAVYFDNARCQQARTYNVMVGLIDKDGELLFMPTDHRNLYAWPA